MYSVQGLHVYCSLFFFSLFPCSTPPTHTFWLSSFHLQCIIFSYCSCDSLMVTLLHLLIPAVRLCWSIALPFPFLVFLAFILLCNICSLTSCRVSFPVRFLLSVYICHILIIMTEQSYRMMFLSQFIRSISGKPQTLPWSDNEYHYEN